MLNDKVKSIFRFNLNLDRNLQSFFTGISNKVSEVKKIILEEREKQKKLKLKLMEQEKKDAQRRLVEQEKLAIEAKKNDRIKVVSESYGYGGKIELIEAGADALILDISELSTTVTSFLPLKET